MAGLKSVENNSEIKEREATNVLAPEENDSEKFEQLTKIDSSRVEKTVKWLFKEYKKGKLRFDKAIQRGEAWGLEQRSDLIHSILYGFPIPPVLVQETDDDFMWFLDGKQRVYVALLSFLQGEFALSKKTEDVYGIKIAGKKFEDLPKSMREHINDATIQLVKIKHITEEEVDKLFVKWNSGTPLRKIELIRAMHSSLIDQIKPIKESPFFSQDIHFTKDAKSKLVDEEIIFTVSMLFEKGVENIKGFSPAQIQEYVTSMKTENKLISEDVISNIQTIIGHMHLAVEEGKININDSKKIFKKSNLPIILYNAKLSMDMGMKPSEYAEFLTTFLVESYNIDSNYGQASQKGTSKKSNVLIRINEMKSALEDFGSYLKKYADNTGKAVELFQKALTKKMNEQALNSINVANKIEEKEVKLEQIKTEKPKEKETKNNNKATSTSSSRRTSPRTRKADTKEENKEVVKK